MTLPRTRTEGKQTPRRLVPGVAVAVAVLAAALLLFERGGVTLRVADDQSGRTLWQHTFAAARVVRLQYVHSVERTPVIEVFRAEPDGLWLQEMRFSSQGAGLPSEGFVREGSEFVLRARRKVGTLRVRVSAVSTPHLAAGGDRLDLVALAGDGAALAITSFRGSWRLRWPGLR